MNFRKMFPHSRKEWKDSLEGSLDRVLFAAKLDFPKILVPRLPQNSSNINTECAGKSKQLYSLHDQLLGALIYLHLIILILLFLIDYVCCKLCNVWLLLFENISMSYHYTGASHWRKNIVAVVTQDREIDDNLKRQIKNRNLHTCRLFLLTRIF